MSLRIRGLVAAVHSPFHANGEVNLAAIEKQAEHLVRDGAYGAFVCGTTGECSSLTLNERLAIAQHWLAVARGTSLKIIIHVGTNCLIDAKAFAAHAELHGAAGVAAVAPCYFKPKDTATPFYYYDIPTMTGVTFSAADVLELAAAKIPNLHGVKFTNADLFQYQRCLRLHDGKFDCPYGIDEAFLAAMALGGSGAVGSGYNFTVPLYRKILGSLADNDLAAARHYQFTAVELIAMLMGFNYLPASKAVMKFLGIDVGPARLPLPPLSAEQERALQPKWEALADKVRGA